MMTSCTYLCIYPDIHRIEYMHHRHKHRWDAEDTTVHMVYALGTTFCVVGTILDPRASPAG